MTGGPWSRDQDPRWSAGEGGSPPPRRALPPVGAALPFVAVLRLLAVHVDLQRCVAFERLAIHRARQHALDVADFEASGLEVEQAHQVLLPVAVHVDALAVAANQATLGAVRAEAERAAIDPHRVERLRREQQIG